MRIKTHSACGSISNQRGAADGQHLPCRGMWGPEPIHSQATGEEKHVSESFRRPHMWGRHPPLTGCLFSMFA